MNLMKAGRWSGSLLILFASVVSASDSGASTITSRLQAEDAARMVGALAWCEAHTEKSEAKRKYRVTRGYVEHALDGAVKKGVASRGAIDFISKTVAEEGRLEGLALETPTCDEMVEDLASLGETEMVPLAEAVEKAPEPGRSDEP